MPRVDVRLGWKRDLPDHRDLSYDKLLFDAKMTLPLKVDLRDRFSVPVYDQGNLGSCTANAIAGALQYLDQAVEHGDPIMHSRLFIYWNERDLEGSVDYDSGAYIRDGVKSVRKLGSCKEDDWPYDISKFTLKPPASAYANAKKDRVSKYYRVSHSLNSMLHCVALGFPFVFGISVYQSFMNAPAGDVPMPGASEPILGGHAMLVVGYDTPNKKFIFRNSWGAGWGTNGYGTLPFDYLTSLDYGDDYWTIRSDTTPSPIVPSKETDTKKELAVREV